MGSSCHSPVTYVPISRHLYLLVLSLFPAYIYFHLPISTSVVFASHWQWLRYALHLLISSLFTYCTSLGTYCPLCHGRDTCTPCSHLHCASLHILPPTYYVSFPTPISIPLHIPSHFQSLPHCNLLHRCAAQLELHLPQ